MKQTLLIGLLGATITLATPSLSFADTVFTITSNTLTAQELLLKKKRQQQAKNKQNLLAKKPVKQVKRIVKNNHGHTHKQATASHTHTQSNNTQKHHIVRNQNINPAFSIAWNVGNSIISYDNRDSIKSHRKQEIAKINKRITRQARKINTGIKNGKLVDREVQKLRYEQNHIKHTMAQYKRDGRINRHERSTLNNLLDVANQHIKTESNNNRTRYAQHKHNNLNKFNNYNNHTYYVQF